jgi:CHAT domain-containing protein
LKQLKSPKILHIATHGFFLDIQGVTPTNDGRGMRGKRAGLASQEGFISAGEAPPVSNQENPLLRSGLALAGFNRRQSGDQDGVLSALEASSLNLRGTQLVVLSACETGIGAIANGEGVYGLRRAFAIAGAQSQLISLWKVSDQGTKDLMVQYYDRLLQNQGRGEALRQVQLDMLKNSAYSHPYYWASFIPSGDWRSMQP